MTTMTIMRMVDVTGKERTVRAAIARGFVATTTDVVDMINSGSATKGDVLAAARLAAIMAVKRTPDLVPLCHPIAIGGVEVEISASESTVQLEVMVKTADRTGVEMEALTAVCAAGLTVIDMIKGTDPAASIESVRVMAKTGGKTGDWQRSADR
jgi:cyclic pyranopterin phosphate synthase